MKELYYNVLMSKYASTDCLENYSSSKLYICVPHILTGYLKPVFFFFLIVNFIFARFIKEEIAQNHNIRPRHKDYFFFLNIETCRYINVLDFHFRLFLPTSLSSAIFQQSGEMNIKMSLLHNLELIT